MGAAMDRTEWEMGHACMAVILPKRRYVRHDPMAILRPQSVRANHGRFAENDHGDHHHGHAHRVFRKGTWVWIYGPDYYAYGDDCGWLLRRARVTGSPYWWNQYNACIGYY